MKEFSCDYRVYTRKIYIKSGKLKKFKVQLLRSNALFLCRHEDTSSLRLFSDERSGRQIIRNFSFRQRLHLISFLDVTFNLKNSTYQPYTKPNTTLQYVHRESNHPPITTKNIPPLRTHHDSQTQKQKAKQDSLVQPSIQQERQQQHRTQIP